MSYTHNQRGVLALDGVSTASLAVVGELTAGYFPFFLRAVAIVATTAPGAEGILEVNHRPTAGSASGETVVDTLTFDGTNLALGKMVYVDGLSQKVLPGEGIAFEITDVAASGVIDVHVVIEEIWELPANNADMAASA